MPIINRFVRAAGLTVGRRDISLAGRVIAAFPDYLTDAQCQSDDLAELGEWVKTPEANVVKLPNISASIPQLVACINELQAQGYSLPDYPVAPENDEERAIAARFFTFVSKFTSACLMRLPSARRSWPVRLPCRVTPSLSSQIHSNRVHQVETNSLSPTPWCYLSPNQKRGTKYG
mgnify:CR=1 FL=1